MAIHREGILLGISSIPSACHENTVQERRQEEGNTPNGFYSEVRGTQRLVSGSGLDPKSQAPQNPASGFLNHHQP